MGHEPRTLHQGSINVTAAPGLGPQLVSIESPGTRLTYYNPENTSKQLRGDRRVQ